MTFVLLPELVISRFIQIPEGYRNWAMLTVLAFLPVLFYRSRLCPSCRKPNLFLRLSAIECTYCGVALRESGAVKHNRQMMLAFGVVGLGFMIPIVVAMTEQRVWSLLIIAPLFLVGLFVVHKYRSKFY